MRIRDWSSDVCSSDLLVGIPLIGPRARRGLAWSAAVAVLLAVASIVFLGEHGATPQQGALPPAGAETRSGEWLHYGNDAGGARFSPLRDRKSVVSGESVAVRVGVGGRRPITKKTYKCRQPI